MRDVFDLPKCTLDDPVSLAYGGYRVICLLHDAPTTEHRPEYLLAKSKGRGAKEHPLEDVRRVER